MKYILITLIFLSGCGTKAGIELSSIDTLPPVGSDEVNSGRDQVHREKARELGISYVDYLHLINNNKQKVLRSHLKLRHQINE
jgi:hypothetical protein